MQTDALNLALEELLTKARAVFDKYDGAFSAIGDKSNEAVQKIQTLKEQISLEIHALANGAGLQHEWEGTSIRFRQKDGSWGSWVNLQGSAGRGFDYEESTNPTISTNPTKPNAKWLNLATAELFVCTDATAGANKWKGNSGTIIQSKNLPSNPINTFATKLFGAQTHTHTFSGASDTDGSVTHYVIDQISSANLTLTAPEVAKGVAHTFRVGNITADETVSFRVRAKDNEGAYSSGITITVLLKRVLMPLAGEPGFGVGVAPASLVSYFGLTPLASHDDPSHENYGGYTDNSGSVMRFIPKHYVKLSHATEAPYSGLRVDVSNTPQQGYSLPRCFINNGVEVAGIFLDVYKGGKEGGVMVSKRHYAPVSVVSNHNPISALTARGQSPQNRMDGMYAAVKTRGGHYSLPTVFVYTMLANLADAHYQACYRNNNFAPCAWADVEPYQPKGCTNALKDPSDPSVVYTASGYSQGGLTGGVSDAVFAKTTHNGQKCGIADLNGLLHEVASGWITSPSGQSMILKESVDVKNLTPESAYVLSHYEPIEIPLTRDDTGRFGNGTNQLFSGSTDRNSIGYKLDNLGIPIGESALSFNGTKRFGQDIIYKARVNEAVLMVGGGYSYYNSAGVRCRHIASVRSGAGNTAGGRACLVPSVAG